MACKERSKGDSRDGDDTWRNTSLAAAPASRELGKAWILKRLVHHAPAIFHSFDFPAFELGNAFEDINVQFTEHGYILVGRSQYEAAEGPAALAPTFAAFKDNLCSVLVVNGLEPVPHETVVESSKTATLHRMKTWRGEGVNLLCGAVMEPTRGILVAQQIADDDRWTYSATSTQRDRMLWFERVYLPCGRKCVARMLLVVHQTKRYDGELIPLDEEAADWGGDLSMCTSLETKEARYRRHAIEFAQKSFAASRERLSRGRNARPSEG
ncbi:hypothetical protein, variant 1 [Aphanomyces invadans]|uniref:Uncharacterized protein n=1 Tax=Aphanomyces invadans TaxID=157072 RepID=A0A024TB10_9STRA|nr:hypothetical protein, variant 1 [Aphanomyces invadans]ETV91233.1 hypothetical protein, variant 1 [Aphanomyces invadans]|eukprot:XP_008880070.1 hypothetical protein, variant 1 [Aphanomyces invadans]